MGVTRATGRRRSSELPHVVVDSREPGMFNSAAISDEGEASEVPGLVRMPVNDDKDKDNKRLAAEGAPRLTVQGRKQKLGAARRVGGPGDLRQVGCQAHTAEQTPFP